MKFSGYQTIKLPDGEEIKGVFPTLTWFKIIRSRISFEGQSVMDVGACDGMYSILAKREGAKEVMAVEPEKEKIEAMRYLSEKWDEPLTILDTEIKNVRINRHFDILLLPMIIHWIGIPETRRLVSWVQKYVVFIYREANEGYNEPENGVWFPTQKELDKTFKNRLDRIYNEVLMTQDNGKKITLAIYEKNIS